MRFVNIWNIMDLKLKPKGNKSMLKKTFNVMQMKKDFSTLVESPHSDIPHNILVLYKTLSKSVGPVGVTGYPVKKSLFETKLNQN